MSVAEQQYKVKLNRLNFSSYVGVDREIENLQRIITVFEAEAAARRKRGEEKRLKEQEEQLLREKAEKAERIISEHNALMKIVAENPVFMDKFHAAMNTPASAVTEATPTVS